MAAAEIAEETDHSHSTIEAALGELVDRKVLRTKAMEGGTRVWWLPGHERSAESPLEPTPPDGVAEGTETGDSQRQRLLDQHRQLADLATRINVTDDLDEILQVITEEARELIGAHQSVTSQTLNLDWEQAINEVSLSEKYADYRDYDDRPDGSGIYALIAERNEPMRLTQAELESHPAWKAFGDDADDHPPMRGWLAVPIVGPDGQNWGLIQLSDKYSGQFTEADEAILVQLANVASAAIENAQLYDDLRESKDRYRTLFDSMTEGYCVVEPVDSAAEDPPDFRYVEANPAFENHTILRDVTDATIREQARSDPDGWIEPLVTVAETTEEVTFTKELEAVGRILRCQAFPVREDGTEQIGMTVQDVTEQVEHERRLEESNKRLEQFAHAASHDLQEPLRMVSSYLRLLEDRHGDDLEADAAEFLEFAVDGADRMRRMIEALLQYSRVETQGEPLEPVELDDVLADVLKDLHFQIEDVDATVNRESLPRVKGDSDQLRQVLQNLLDNALTYSGDGPPTIDLSAERRGQRWVISVTDDGIGIQSENTDAIFDVFERLHGRDQYPGTGIGLALCQRIVERHGGDIWAEAEPGEGSTFSFSLPAAETSGS